MDGENVIVVLVTAPKGEGSRIARHIVEKRLAACVNIISNIRSFYWWEGKIQDDEEELLIIKTRRDFFEKLMDEVKRVHPYTVPEILALPVVAGNPDYVKWVYSEVGSGGPGQS
ncbi:MAG: divalent-cation tolerance protein CutA [Desulfurococcales archaeon]|nr:divalent-cation tolerance protein CutA [Desulfurococcales archaeon]